MIKQENIDRIISDVSIRDVAIDEGITFSKERGGKLWACCPFHNENTPSFFVDTGTNTWKCYGGCHSGGNVISLYRKLKNDLPFPIACKELAKKYLNEDIEDDYKPSKEDEEKQKEKESLQIILSYVQEFYVQCIHEVNPAANKARETVRKDGELTLLRGSNRLRSTRWFYRMGYA